MKDRVVSTLSIGLLTLLAVGMMMFATPKAGAAFKFLEKGAEVPDFTLENLDGGEVTLAGLKEGKAAVLFFWATWSPRSLLEMQDLESFHREFKDQGLKVVGINVNHLTFTPEDIRDVRAAIKETGVTFPVVLDKGLEVYNSFGVVAAPSTAVIDPSGRIIYEAASYLTLTGEEIKGSIEVALGLKEAPSEDVAAREEEGYKPVRKALLYYNLGRNLLKMGSRDKAMDKLVTSVEADDKYAAPRILLGHLYLDESASEPELLGQAQTLFGEALKNDPQNVSALTGLGEVLYRSEKLDEAEARFREAVEIAPAYTPALSGLASVFAGKGLYEEAGGKFQEALELNPLNHDVYLRRAISEESQGKLGEAARDLRKAVEILLGYGITDGEA